MNRTMKQASHVSGKRLSVCKWVAVVALLGLATLPAAGAVSRNWIGGTGTWDDTTGANWSPSGVPVNGDTAQIATPGVSVAYTAANLSGTGLNEFHLMNTGTGTSTFTLDGTDLLPATRVVSVGRWATGAATLNLTGNALVTISGGGSGLILGGSVGTGPYVLNQTGGTITNGISAGSLVYIYPNATYNLSGGSYVANRNLDLHGGTFNQTGGTVTLASGYGMTINAFSTFTSSAGTFNQGGSISIGQDARVSWTGGTLNGAIGRLKLTGAGASWVMQGITATVNPSGTTSASKDSLVLVASSTIRGYGTIQDARFGTGGSFATFDNSGRVIADGYGVDRTLDLSRFRSLDLTNTTDNAMSNGWFAVSGGKLLLPTVAVPVGSSVTNWGEAAADTSIDLVNSARIAFTGASAGNLTGTLLAVDRADVPAGLYRPTAVWTLGGIACSGATLTFRYDDAAVAALNVGESDLRVWRHNGVKWLEITGTQDSGTKTITSQATGSLAVTSFFAVAGKAPAAGTLVTIR